MEQDTATGSWPRDGGDAPRAPGERPGDSIGPYRLLEPVGEGGFGVVWLAERREPFVQRVALKIIKPGMDSRAVVARFEQERQALAVMDHPNVAHVYDAGTTPASMGSRPYFVMEYVRGEPITSYCDRHTLTVGERLELFVHVCEAVQHAHMKGIIHRDLKPSNILVAVPDTLTSRTGPAETRPAASGASALVKVIDFGVAKAVTHSLTDKTIYTERGQIIGTPEYMSPEQSEMGAVDVDTRTDVYSLGVVLYELLTGVLPFESSELRSKGYGDIQRIIREVEPLKPSTRLSALERGAAAAEDGAGAGATAESIASHRRTDRRALESQLKRELDWIPLKAMRKDRLERYRSPADLADDVRNYLEGRPLAAGPRSAAYHARKFLRKHRLGVGVATVLGATLVAATVVSWSFYRRASIERDAALQVERFLANDLLSMGGGADPVPGLLARTLVDRAAATLEGRFPRRPAVEGRVRAAVGGAYLAVGESARAAEQLRRAVDLLDGSGASSGDDRFRAASQLAEALYRQGKAPEAEALLLPAIDARRARLGDDDPLVLDARNQLAGALKHAGKADEAEAIYTDVLERRRRLFGPVSAPALTVQYNLALVALVRAQQARAQAPEKARPLLEQALGQMDVVLDAARANLGPDEDVTLWAGAERASLLSRLGRFGEAAAAFRPVLTGMKGQFGERHWRTLEAMANFGIACAGAEAWADARDSLAEAADGYREVRGPAYPDTIAVMRQLARAQEKMGDLAGAEKTLTAAYEAMGAAGTESSRLRAQAALIAAFFQRQGDGAKAEEWARRGAGPPGN